MGAATRDRRGCVTLSHLTLQDCVGPCGIKLSTSQSLVELTDADNVDICPFVSAVVPAASAMRGVSLHKFNRSVQ